MTDAPTIIRWIRSTFPRARTADPYVLLELPPTDDVTAIDAAYTRLAEERHPDRFRDRLGRTELAMLEAVWAAVDAAHRRLQDPLERRALGVLPSRVARGTTPAPQVARGSDRITRRALHHAHQARAFVALGDHASAVLYLRMAIAADPAADDLRALLGVAERALARART